MEDYLAEVVMPEDIVSDEEPDSDIEEEVPPPLEPEPEPEDHPLRHN